MNTPNEERLYVQRMITEFRELLASYGAEQRLEMIKEATKGFCTACGSALKPAEICHCENDE